MVDQHTTVKSTSHTHRYDHANSWASAAGRREIVTHWGRYIENQVNDGWTPYLLTFQYRQIGGSRRRMIDEMSKEVERVYATLLTRVVRRPASPHSLGKHPVWIVCPDYPVWKREKQLVRDVTVNDGIHFQGIGLMPPKSRLAQPLDEHFDENAAFYVRGKLPLIRAHAKPITESIGRATDYTMKAFKTGRVSHDEMLILPRALSEIVRR